MRATSSLILRAQPGIDPARIFVLGHSEGGELAPSIAIADEKLAGIVLLAPPALPLEQMLMQQLLRIVPADATSLGSAERCKHSSTRSPPARRAGPMRRGCAARSASIRPQLIAKRSVPDI